MISLLISQLFLDELSVRSKAIDLVDSVLEQSVLYLSSRDALSQHYDDDHVEGQDNAPAVENHKESFFDHPPTLHVNIADYMHSDSENFAITCDLSNDAEFMKSPTIESISGKSFDDNISPQEEHDLIGLELNLPAEGSSQIFADRLNEQITTKFENLTSQLDDESNDLCQAFEHVLDNNDDSRLQNEFSNQSWNDNQSANTIGSKTPENDFQGD